MLKNNIVSNKIFFKRKSPLANFSYTLSGRIFDTLLMLFFFAVVARTLGKESFGLFLYATSVAILLSASSDLGTSSLIIREIAKDNTQGVHLFSNIMGFRMVIILIICLFSFAGGYFFPKNRDLLNAICFCNHSA